MDTILHFGGPGLAVSLFALGVGIIRLEEFAKARALFWAAAILFAGPALAWQLTTLEPWPFRVISGAIAAIVVFVIFPRSLEWLKKREAAASGKS